MRNSGRNRSQRVFIRRKLKKRCSLFLSLSISVYTNKGQEIQNKFPFIKSLPLPRILPIPSFQISVNLQISNLDNESDTSLKIIDRRAGTKSSGTNFEQRGPLCRLPRGCHRELPINRRNNNFFLADPSRGWWIKDQPGASWRLGKR